jgi:hypothetical protein
VVEEVLPMPSLTLQVEEADWRTPLIDYIARGTLHEDEKGAKQFLRKAARFAVVESHLFRKGVFVPLLKCIGPKEVWYVLA